MNDVQLGELRQDIRNLHDCVDRVEGAINGIGSRLNADEAKIIVLETKMAMIEKFVWFTVAPALGATGIATIIMLGKYLSKP